MRGPIGAAMVVAAAVLAPAAATAADLRETASSEPPIVITNISPNMLGTVAVPIRAARFSDSMKRAREDATRAPALLRLIEPARRLPPLQQLALVQRAVNANIRWASDATEWRQHDYWASAAQTLALGAGDMEDRAIVKLQALRALGFNNSDLFLTMARDRVGGPITVLSVRVNGRYFILDDTGGAPFPADQRRFEFEPQISFGYYGAWVHVRSRAIASAAPGAGPAYARK